MSWPHPRPGMVIRYGYVWTGDHERGQQEGKDRPAAVIVVLDRHPELGHGAAYHAHSSG